MSFCEDVYTINESGMNNAAIYDDYVGAESAPDNGAGAGVVLEFNVTVCFMLSEVNGFIRDDIWVNISTSDDSAVG